MAFLDHLFFPFVRWFNKSPIPFFSSLTTIHRKFFEEANYPPLRGCHVASASIWISFHFTKSSYSQVCSPGPRHNPRPFSCVGLWRAGLDSDVQLTWLIYYLLSERHRLCAGFQLTLSITSSCPSILNHLAILLALLFHAMFEAFVWSKNSSGFCARTLSWTLHPPCHFIPGPLLEWPGLLLIRASQLR